MHFRSLLSKYREAGTCLKKAARAEAAVDKDARSAGACVRNDTVGRRVDDDTRVVQTR